jgi:hypothetical protein
VAFLPKVTGRARGNLYSTQGSTNQRHRAMPRDKQQKMGEEDAIFFILFKTKDGIFL